MKPPGRIVPVIAILALLALMGGGVYYASLDNEDLESAIIELTSVEILDVNSVENTATLNVTFTITNPSDLHLLFQSLLSSCTQMEILLVKEYTQQKMLLCREELRFILEQKYH